MIWRWWWGLGVILLVLSTSAVAQQRHVAIVGDSLTSSSGASPVCPVGCVDPVPEKWVEIFATLRPGWLITNHAIAGMPLGPPSVLPTCLWQATRAAATGATDLVIACGTNDLVGGASGATAFTRLLAVVSAWTNAGGNPTAVYVATIPPAFTPNSGCQTSYVGLNAEISALNAAIVAHGGFTGVIRRDLLTAEDYRLASCYDPAGIVYDATTCACYDGLHPGDGRPWDPSDGAHAKWARELLSALPPDSP